MTLIGIVAALIISTLAYLMIRAQLKSIELLEETLTTLQQVNSPVMQTGGYLGVPAPVNRDELRARLDEAFKTAKKAMAEKGIDFDAQQQREVTPEERAAMDTIFPRAVHEDVENFLAKRDKYLKLKEKADNN